MGGLFPLPYPWLRSTLFRLNPETAHHLAQAWIRYAGFSNRRVNRHRTQALPSTCQDALEVHCMGLQFDSPVGLAAGFDKGEVLGPGLFALGFGFLEIGTITPKPQSGNPKPRLFRIPNDQALINRMGFNNLGATETAKRLERWDRNNRYGPIGINIGKNKETPLDAAIDDYMIALNATHNEADYVVINVSSPNTPGLRNLQKPDTLRKLLETIVKECNAKSESRVGLPVLVKIDPDQDNENLDQMVDVIGASGCKGIIATNTTVNRSNLPPRWEKEPGGLSGKPLADRALATLRRVAQRSSKQLVLVGVGGIDSGQAAYERILAGASLVQIYTGLIYHGPQIVEEIHKQLVELLRKGGFKTLKDAIGADLN